jgi:hypothetical protein
VDHPSVKEQKGTKNEDKATELVRARDTAMASAAKIQEERVKTGVEIENLKAAVASLEKTHKSQLEEEERLWRQANQLRLQARDLCSHSRQRVILGDRYQCRLCLSHLVRCDAQTYQRLLESDFGRR